MNSAKSSEVTFPHTDESGTVWVSRHVFLASVPERCFICGVYTYRLDISWGAAFCGSVQCFDIIDRELESGRDYEPEGGYDR